MKTLKYRNYELVECKKSDMQSAARPQRRTKCCKIKVRLIFCNLINSLKSAKNKKKSPVNGFSKCGIKGILCFCRYFFFSYIS